LPFEFTNLSDTVTRYTTELQTLLRQRQDTIRDQNRAIDEKLYDVVRDPKKTAVPPEKKEVPPALNFAPLVNATAALTEAANRYHRAADAATARLASSPEIVKAVNARLMQSERELTDQGGLPGRPWYRHLLYAPGVETGYGAKTMPGAREGIEQGRYAEAEHEIARIAEALQREVRLVDAAAGELERLGK
jgi:N-acetylated-alpha-linked acidic dipeptidase